MSIVDSIVDRITVTLDAKAREAQDRVDALDALASDLDLDRDDEIRLWDAIAQQLTRHVDPHEFADHQEAATMAVLVATFADALIECRRDFVGGVDGKDGGDEQ